MKNLKRRIGKISYTVDLIGLGTEGLEELFTLLKFIPFRAEMMYHNNMIELAGISRHFREVPEGEEMPKYEIIVNETEGYITGIEVKEII